MLTVPKRERLRFFRAMSPSGLRWALRHNELHCAARTRDGVIAYLATKCRTYFGGTVLALREREARRVSRALGLDAGTLSVHFEACAARAHARRRGLGCDGVTTELLVEAGIRLARPTVYLVPCGRERAASRCAAWRDPLAHGGIDRWLRVDMRVHPVERYRRLGTLTLFVDAGNGVARAETAPTRPPRHVRGETRLASLAWVELPTLPMLRDHGPASLRAWMDRLSPDDADAHPALRGYDDFRRAAFPARAYAQLGGWEQAWPDDHAGDYDSRTLLVRTIRWAEPYVEVFDRAGALEARCRVT